MSKLPPDIRDGNMNRSQQQINTILDLLARMCIQEKGLFPLLDTSEIVFRVLCSVVIFLVHVRVAPVEDHQDYQENWEVQRESETAFTQSKGKSKEIKGEI